MGRFLFALITVGLLVSGCASAPPPAGGGRFAWDGLGQDPNKPAPHARRPMVAAPPRVAVKPDPNLEREKVLATFQPYSSAWWAVRDEIDAEEHRRINEKIVICRSCLRSAHAQDYTASVRP
jgi:hypothetical protein